MVLLAICDPGYCFTLFDFGSYGSNNDSDVLANSAMRKAFESSDFNLLRNDPLNGYEFSPFLYLLSGENIFPLKKRVIQTFLWQET